jgi:hypothetical protein
MADKTMFYTVFMVFDAYYTMNKPECINQENNEYRDSTERRFRDYYAGHKDLWIAMPMAQKMQISSGVRGRSVNEGMQMESVTIEQWLKHIEGLV